MPANLNHPAPGTNGFGGRPPRTVTTPAADAIGNLIGKTMLYSMIALFFIGILGTIVSVFASVHPALGFIAGATLIGVSLYKITR